jgi:hypothetical protein
VRRCLYDSYAPHISGSVSELLETLVSLAGAIGLLSQDPEAGQSRLSACYVVSVMVHVRIFFGPDIVGYEVCALHIPMEVWHS